MEDYVIRILEASGQHLENAKVIAEKPLAQGLIENGRITDEIQFYQVIKELVKKYSLKNRLVRFYVPNSLVIMRQVEFPTHLKDKEEIIDYFSLEIGKNIHLPFKEPVFDVYYQYDDDADLTESETMQFQEMKTAVLFAAPREEMQRYTDIFVDASLKPVVADVNAFGVYRYYQKFYETNPNRVYLFAELNVTSINLSVFSENQLEFLRYQDLDVQLSGWKVDDEMNEIKWQFVEDEELVRGIVSDQVTELGRIMNFYRYSMQQGEKQITDIIILGDHPYKDHFYQQMKEQFELRVQYLTDFQAKSADINSAFIPALGLAIEGGTKL